MNPHHLREWITIFLVATIALLTAFAPPHRAHSASPQPANAAPRQRSATTTNDTPTSGMVRLPGGTFLMGTTDGTADEGPVRRVRVRTFSIDRTEVTVAQFAAFVRATGHRTAAERIGYSRVFAPEEGRWVLRDRANWRTPEGPDHRPAHPDHPVTQVSYHDAQSYARWARKRLPTEAEWEYAARGGLIQKHFPWGDDLPTTTALRANLWQGDFPTTNTLLDGHLLRAPVATFAPNGYGLHDMSGNVWEWTTGLINKPTVPLPSSPSANPPPAQPAAAASLHHSSFNLHPSTDAERVTRGGSFLCGITTCKGYRVASRQDHNPNTGLNNLGFRCVR